MPSIRAKSAFVYGLALAAKSNRPQRETWVTVPATLVISCMLLSDEDMLAFMQSKGSTQMTASWQQGWNSK